MRKLILTDSTAELYMYKPYFKDTRFFLWIKIEYGILYKYFSFWIHVLSRLVVK